MYFKQASCVQTKGWGLIELFVLHSKTWNRLTVCKDWIITAITSQYMESFDKWINSMNGIIKAK